MPGVTISTGTVDRLLDAHSYSVKLVTQRTADRNRDDVKHSRKLYAQWLQSDGPRVCRFYLDETNYHIWCSRNFGRATKGQPAVHTTTTTKGANLSIMALKRGRCNENQCDCIVVCPVDMAEEHIQWGHCYRSPAATAK
ncbi:hypothetical protein HPB52_023550 [Rhipicephalus sanguineus]|uniref:Uncharacterized protein n=1 Tax=Rhipicephalus sanguineus TaxID=34632 RepID=A0A9D4PGY3_RHISA|nr:hypothetical protein HPB52_023550 [Rhipicephalus sanguineus]